MRKRPIVFFVLLILSLSLPVLAEENAVSSKAWEVLTLNQCLDLARKNNKQLQESHKNVTIAENAVKEAEAAFWPTVGYQVARNQSDLPVNSLYSKVESVKGSYSAGLSASVPLYTGGALENRVKLTKIQLEAKREDLRKAEQQLTYSVKEAYYDTWLADQVLQVEQDSYANMQKHTARVEALYKAGSASKFNLLQAQVQRDTLKPKVITAQNDLVLAKLQLAMLTGFPKEQPFEVSYDVNALKMPQSVTLALQKVLDAAYQNRPEMRQLKQVIEIDQIQTELAKSATKPNVALSADTAWANENLGMDDWGHVWRLTLSVSGKVYDRTTKAKVDQAKSTQEVAALQEADLRDSIRWVAEQSLQNLEVGIETTRANQANIKLSQESLRMTQARFDAGMSTTMDVMDAQLALDQAQTGYYQGIVTYLLAEAKLDTVMGKD